MLNHKSGILTFCCLLIVSGCLLKEAKDTIVSEKTIFLNEQGIVIKCDPPLSRTHNSASIMIALKEEWVAVPPWKEIRIQNGDMVSINVSLHSVSGTKYFANIIGKAMGCIEARFDPEIPNNIDISSVVVSSSLNLTCEKIFWHNYDPL